MAIVATLICWGVVVVTWIAGAAYGARTRGSRKASGSGALWRIGAVVATRIPIEERLMSQTFPDEYARYRKRVPRFIPGLQLLRRSHRAT